MIRNAVSEELKYTDEQLNGIVLTGYVYPNPKWMFARLDKDGGLTVSHITPLLEVRNTIYPKGHISRPKFIPFPKGMNLKEFRKCNLHGLFIRDFIREHVGVDV